MTRRERLFGLCGMWKDGDRQTHSHVPQPCIAVRACGCNETIVRRERDRRDAAALRKRVQQSARPRVPDVHIVVRSTAAGGYEPAIMAERPRCEIRDGLEWARPEAVVPIEK